MDVSSKTMNNMTMEELRLSELMDPDLSRHDMTEDSARISDESVRIREDHTRNSEDCVRMNEDNIRMNKDAIEKYKGQHEYLGETIVAGSSDMVHPQHRHSAGQKQHRHHGSRGIIVQSSPIKKHYKSMKHRESQSSHTHTHNNLSTHTHYDSCTHVNGYGMQPYLEMREKGSTGSRDSTLSRNMYQPYQGECFILLHLWS